jgi:AraC family transcriptional regulator of adaptative response/methylated-DNA-[protein]-cysteine methyltransferase
MPTVATIHYGQAPTPFGPGLIGWNAQGILMLHLLQADDPEARGILAQLYPGCSLQRADTHARELLEQAFHQEPSGEPGKPAARLKLVLNGSPFQLKVWQGLREIPLGHVRTYGELAEALGHPGAARAVGTALAANQLAYVVPCHRVIRASGESGQYRWGAERKAQMLAWETRQLAESNAAR